jgi:DNA-binding NarL/FixJ family response regulator
MVSAPAGPPDWAAVVRGISGDRYFRMRPIERSEAIHALTEYGLSARQIAARLGVDPRTVHRHRARHRNT